MRDLKAQNGTTQDIDVSATAQHFKISSINSSRSAFGVFNFDPDFFSRYDLQSQPGETAHVSFSVTAKVRSLLPLADFGADL